MLLDIYPRLLGLDGLVQEQRPLAMTQDKITAAAQDDISFSYQRQKVLDFSVEEKLDKTDLLWQGRVEQSPQWCPQWGQAPGGR